MGYFIFLVFFIVLSLSLRNVIAQREAREGGGELLVTKLLIANISDEAIGMFNKSELLETYPSEDFR